MPVPSNCLSVSVLLPTYNEHDNLPIITYLIVKELDKVKGDCIDDYEIIIIDDNSPDGTGKVADRLQAIYPPGTIRVVKRAGKLGLGSAYIHGAGQARFDHIVILDADLSHHPRAIPAMVRKMLADPQLDICYGSRYVPGGGIHGWTLVRRLTSRGANFLADFLLDPQVSDLTSSFRIYKKAAFLKLIQAMVTRGYTFQMEIMVRAKQLGFKVGQDPVPIEFVDRQFGESKLGSGEIIGYLKGLWTLFTTC